MCMSIALAANLQLFVQDMSIVFEILSRWIFFCTDSFCYCLSTILCFCPTVPSQSFLADCCTVRQSLSLSSGLTVGHSGFFGHFLPGVLLILFLIGCLCLSVLLLLNHAEFLLLASLVVAAIVKPENLVLVFASISLLTSISALSVLGFSFSPVRSPVFLLS